jgi:two-component system LytT family sensor kinase
MSSIYGQFVPRLFVTECVVVSTMLLLSHGLRRIIRQLNWVQRPVKQLLPRLLAAHTGLALVSQVLMWLLLTLVVDWVLHMPFSYPQHLLLAYVLQVELVLFMWSSLYFGLHYLANYRQAGIEKWKLAATLSETEAAHWRLAATLREAEMRSLKAQINPHFMFNGLNNIRFLVMDDPARARRMITHLADLLRYSIQLNSTEQVPLAQELKIVEYYLELEAVQLEERLTYTFEVDASALETQIPPMTLQLLIENAIKHGIAPLPAGGHISLTAQSSAEKQELCITVRNTGKYRPPSQGDGIGLRNARERLQLLFGERASLNIADDVATPGTVTACLRLPLIPHPALS